MPTPNTRITSSGTYLINGNFDEVTGAIITNGLVVYLDAGRTASGASTGTTWLDVVSSYRSTLTNITYSNTGGGSLFYANNGGASAASLYSLAPNFWSSTSWTVSAWFNFSAVRSSGSGDNAVLSHGVTIPSAGLHLGERGGTAYFGMYGNDQGGNIQLATGAWNNVVYQYNSSTFAKTIYVNGRLDVTSVGAAYTNTTYSNTEIGRYWGGTTHFLTGYMGQVAIYNRTLSPIEIARNYQTLLGRYTTTGTYTRSRVAPGVAYYDQIDEVTYNPNNGIASINQFAYSQYFTSTNWTPGNAFVILNTSTVIAPDGSRTATKLVDIAGAGQHTLSYSPAVSFVTGQTYNFSIYVKAEEISSIGVYLPGGNSGAKYNVSTGALIFNDTGITSSITPYPNGWWRINATYTSVLTSTLNPQLYMMNPATSYTAVGGQGLYIWGAQFELNATTASIYVATTASGVKSTSFVQRTDALGSAYVSDSFDEVTGMIVTNGLLLYLDGNYSVGDSWTDLSNYRNNAKLQNAPTYNSTGSSFVFNGSNQKAQISTSSLNVSYTGKTIFVVARLSATAWTPGVAQYRGMCGTDGGPRNFNFYVYHDAANVIYLHYSTPGSAFLTNAISLNTNTWFMAAVTQSASTTTVYLNGVSIYSVSGQTLNQYTYGGNEYVGTADNYWAGDIAACAFYTRDLSAAEILNNYNAFASRVGLP
jgi:hypothetical protein